MSYIQSPPEEWTVQIHRFYKKNSMRDFFMHPTFSLSCVRSQEEATSGGKLAAAEFFLSVFVDCLCFLERLELKGDACDGWKWLLEDVMRQMERERDSVIDKGREKEREKEKGS